jgi:phage terminase Nu1 subunit (DNA packaging protein)
MRFLLDLIAVLVLGIVFSSPLLFAGDAGAPPLEPIPKIAPLVPSIANTNDLTPDEKLQRQLETLVRDRDNRIRSLLDERGDLRPADGRLQHTSLEEPFRERNRAQLELRRALENYDERSTSRQKDILAANRPIEQAFQRSSLAATNQLRIAECYYDLSLTTQPIINDLNAGIAALDLIEVNDLEEGDPVRYRYLRAWFLIEHARLAHGEAQAAYLKDATSAVERLTQDFPTSELTLTARNLLKRLGSPTPVNP